jgi:hypothetical protein
VEQSEGIVEESAMLCHLIGTVTMQDACLIIDRSSDPRMYGRQWCEIVQNLLNEYAGIPLDCLDDGDIAPTSRMLNRLRVELKHLHARYLA